MPLHQINSRDTYIHLIKANIYLIKKLIKASQKEHIAFNPNDTEPFYKSRARHLQTMALFGVTCEQLLKVVLLTRGYSIFEVDHVKESEIKYSDKTISFNKVVSLFTKSNSADYFHGVQTYEFNQHDIDYVYSYLGHCRIDPRTCISLIQKIRNNYIHSADSLGEWNGIIWYIYNFIVWLAKKEFERDFSRFKYIGNDEIRSLFNS